MNIPAVRLNLETAVAEKIWERLEDIIHDFALDMAAGGSYIAEDGNVTGQNFCRGVGLVQGLRRAQNVCKEVEDELIRGKNV